MMYTGDALRPGPKEQVHIGQGKCMCQAGWGDLRVVTLVCWTLKDREDAARRQRRREGHCRWKHWRERAGWVLEMAGSVVGWLVGGTVEMRLRGLAGLSKEHGRPHSHSPALPTG